jgi:hypothetical protein
VDDVELERRARRRAAYLWRQYGLTPAEFLAMAANGCQACGAQPKPGRSLHVDHEHVKGWKAMLPEERRQYVRGVLCWHCNSVLRVRVTVEQLRALADYLQRYFERKGAWKNSHQPGW